MSALPDGDAGAERDGAPTTVPDGGPTTIEERTDGPVTVDRAPARLSSWLAAVFAAVSALALLPVVPGATLAVSGAAAVIVGLFAVGSRRLVTAGAVCQVGGAVLGGALGLPVELVLVGAAAGVLAWDLGENAISVGEQLGRRADTGRGELVHATASVAVAVAVVVVGDVVYRLSGSGEPLAALVLLVTGVVLVLWGVRR